jgi:uncharacterized membrane protein
MVVYNRHWAMFTKPMPGTRSTMPAVQEIVAGVLVFAAAVYLAYRGWQVLARRRSGGCGGGGCSTCSSGAAKQEEPQGFVSVEQLTQRPAGTSGK